MKIVVDYRAGDIVAWNAAQNSGIKSKELVHIKKMIDCRYERGPNKGRALQKWPFAVLS